MHPYIRKYRNHINEILERGGTTTESAVRPAFINLINDFAKKKSLSLISEIRDSNNNIPDGTLRDNFGITLGYYEAKDEKDNLDKEIHRKFERRYSSMNILFENSQTAVLFQNDTEVKRVAVKDDQALEEIIIYFLAFRRENIEAFNEAVDAFEEDIPQFTTKLRELIEQAQSNQEFVKKRDHFLMQCQQEINPQITKEDIREMILQHFLTSRLFNIVFSEIDFHRKNNIASKIDLLCELAFDTETKKDFETRTVYFYNALQEKAGSVKDHHDKQNFLKVLYEKFYKAYNPKASDRLGIIYTPTEIVQFIIESVDYFLYKYFNKGLGSQGVNILDPATGTGTFITDLIDYLPSNALTYKYAEEIFCNEVAILPYYIAALNIEYTYWQKMGDYKEFSNISFVDTLDNHYALDQQGIQQKIGFLLTEENTQKIRRQNEKKISVIMGNPPYNANQKNYNEHNANRKYEEIDNRIKESFAKESNAQKLKLEDMYVRFYRWAMDRLDPKRGGIVAFVTNNSFINARGFDGFRKIVKRDFDYIYIVDLGGNIRTNFGRSISNVFDIQVGVCIAFFIKTPLQPNRRPNIFYHTLEDAQRKAEKLIFLKTTKIEDLPFENIFPDTKHNWLNITDNDFEGLLPLCSKQTKNVKEAHEEQALFKLFSNGVVTARDAWVYDFDKKNLERKAQFLSQIYNESIEKEKMDDRIKWSRDMKDKFLKKGISEYNQKYIYLSLFRPFAKRYYYAEKIFSDVLTKNHYVILGKYGKKENKVIAFSASGYTKPFHCLAVKNLVDLHFTESSQCLPLYRYNEQGEKIDNITAWGLKQFQNHYGDPTITKEAIFYYVYGILHCDKYRLKYKHNLKRDFPHIPFYKDFFYWSVKGKKLMDLHIYYEKAELYPLTRRDLPLNSVLVDSTPLVKLKADKGLGQIQIDEQTLLSGVPPLAWEYRLGNRSALEWVLDQYKEKKIQDKTIAERFNIYRFADYKEEVINLLKKICTVSIETINLLDAVVKS